NLSLDLRTLTRRNFGFVKLDAGMLLQVMRQDDGPRQIDAMIEQLTDHRITLIVEKVETERELVELLDHNIHFGQGYLFGEPRESKALQ
ncbi:MAG: EAL domain-containing protein, partial [Alphaproteobacteria bacterium]|nr:EAL domain-containing protein [Alphaproteobacteria bacterium]